MVIFNSAGMRKRMVIRTLQAEAEAIHFGLSFAIVAGLRSIEGESDCLTLVKQLQVKSQYRTTTQILVNVILVLAGHFDHC